MAAVFALIVIDMTQEQVYIDGISFLPENWSGYTNILKLSKLLPTERVFDSRLWMTVADNSSLFEIYESGRENSEGAERVSHLQEMNATFVKKVQYSIFYKSEMERLLNDQGVTDILLTGIHTDYCVLASALDAFYRKFKVHLVKDACASLNGESGHSRGIDQFEMFLLNYGTVVSTEEAVKLIQFK